MGEMMHESSIEVSKAQEGLDYFDWIRHWPVFGSTKFVGIHSDFTQADENPQEFDFGDIEEALFPFGKEIILGQSRDNFNGASTMGSSSLE